MPESLAERLARFAATVLENRWIPEDHRRPMPPNFHPAPTLPQAEFLMCDASEVLYGGSAGGGKSDAGLMAALRYVDVPGYSAGIFRRTFADLALPNALMDRARRWLAGTEAKWNDQSHSWRFPSGATLTFGYLQDPGDELRYQGSEFQFLFFDELTQLREDQYRYLISRVRRLSNSAVPLQVASGTNPGGPGHEWVMQRFLTEGVANGRAFIPARLRDNPHLDQESYERGLQQLDPVRRAQLLDGDWTVRQPGNLFRREWFPIVDAPPPNLRMIRRWDMAATEPRPGTDPDWTAGALVGIADGRYYIVNIRKLRGTPQQVEEAIRHTASVDSRQVPVRMEQEPGSSGVTVIDHYRRRVLVGYDFQGVRSTGSKVSRASIVSSAAQAGNVALVRGPWLNDFLDEIEAFPQGSHDDQVDAVSGAFEDLANSVPAQWVPNLWMGARG